MNATTANGIWGAMHLLCLGPSLLGRIFIKKIVLFSFILAALSFDARPETEPFDKYGGFFCTVPDEENKQYPFRFINIESADDQGVRDLITRKHGSKQQIYKSVCRQTEEEGSEAIRCEWMVCWSNMICKGYKITLIQDRVSLQKNQCNNVYAYKITGDLLETHAFFKLSPSNIVCLQHTDPYAL